VNDASGLHIVIAIDDLIHEFNSIWFIQALLAGDMFGEISAIAEFGDDIGVVLGVIDVIDIEYIFTVLECLEDLYFRGE
jgi:hypothetical protein